MKRTFYIVSALVLMVLMIAIVAGCGVTSGGGSSGPHKLSKLYITTYGKDLLVFDVATFTVESSTSFPDTPAVAEIFGVAVAGNALFVVDSSSNNVMHKKALSNLAVTESIYIDAATMEGMNLYLASSPDGTKVFVPTNSRTVEGLFVFNVSPFSLRSLVTIECSGVNYGVGVAVSPDSKKAYVTFKQPHRLLKYDIDAATFEARLDLPNQPGVPKMNSAGTKLYISLDTGIGNDGKLLVVNPSNLSVITTIEGLGRQPWYIEILSDGKVYFPGSENDVISVIENDVFTKNITCETGTGPWGIIKDEGRTRVYVAGNANDKILSINTATDSIEVVRSINCLGGNPDQIAGK